MWGEPFFRECKNIKIFVENELVGSYGSGRAYVKMREINCGGSWARVEVNIA
jgi:hypothetical protein